MSDNENPGGWRARISGRRESEEGRVRTFLDSTGGSIGLLVAVVGIVVFIALKALGAI